MGDRQQPFPRASRGMNVYFKTKLCGNFMERRCVYGEGCSYAHGQRELRRAPFEDRDEERVEERRNSRQEVCRRFGRGDGCSYGERCIFLHNRPEGCEESSAIRVRAAEEFQANRDAYRERGWKERPCYKWELAGQCSYGDSCINAHGQSELWKVGGHREQENKNAAAGPSIENLSDKAEASDMHEGSQNNYLRACLVGNSPTKFFSGRGVYGGN